jgi:hypothetical protein
LHEAFQYAPDKRAATLAELYRILPPEGGFAIVCFEVEPAKVEGLPVRLTSSVRSQTRVGASGRPCRWRRRRW